MKDSLGDRMKTYYEDRTRIYLPRRTYTVIRIDGKAFHSYTKGLERPFDLGLIEDMNETTKFLCENIQGTKLGYVQSDEISIVLTDFDNLGTSAWFDNNIQKMVSIASSMTTAKFNQLRFQRGIGIDELKPVKASTIIKQFKLATFDARVFTIPTKTETINYFIWRQEDATRNSIQSVAQSLYSHKELHLKNTNQMQEMIYQKGINWNEYDSGLKRGRLIVKEYYDLITNSGVTVRSKWDVVDTPIFKVSDDNLSMFIPVNE